MMMPQLIEIAWSMEAGESWLDYLTDSIESDGAFFPTDYHIDPAIALPSEAAVEDFSADWTDLSLIELWERYCPSLPVGDNIAGDSDTERYWWNYQGNEQSCAIVAQQGVLESILDRDLSSAELIELAEDRGWYDPNSGTPIEDFGKILDVFDIPTERGFDYEFSDIYRALASGEKVIVGLNAYEIWDPQENPDGTPLQQEYGGHAVWVTGLVEDEGEVFVVMNDSGPTGGSGEKVELKHFLNAWDDSGNFALVTKMNA